MAKNRIHRIRVIRPIYKSLAVAEEARHWFTPDASINSSTRVAELFAHLEKEAKEVFICCHLNAKNQLVCFETVSMGSLTASIVHPRETFKSALLSSAAAVVLVHNHPSGDPTPSREDLDITKRMKEAGELLGIRVLDHVIIGTQGRFVSFADRDLL